MYAASRTRRPQSNVSRNALLIERATEAIPSGRRGVAGRAGVPGWSDESAQDSSHGAAAWRHAAGYQAAGMTTA
jgi:hypothetical protein